MDSNEQDTFAVNVRTVYASDAGGPDIDPQQNFASGRLGVGMQKRPTALWASLLLQSQIGSDCGD
jgi:hypothetical protein